MSINIEFTFKEEELEATANITPATQVVFSLRNFKRRVTGELDMFVFAQAFDGNVATSPDNIIAGCPVPPGWQQDEPEPPGVIKGRDLDNCAKFAVGIMPLKALITKNEFENPFHEHQVSAVLEGNKDNLNKLKVALSIKCLDKTGQELAPPLDAPYFA